MGADRGRMNKWAFLKDMIHGADVIIEVLDARDIQGTRLPLAEKWAGSRRLLVVANKTDLLPPGSPLPALWNSGVALSARNAGKKERQMLFDAIMARTQARPVRALLVGYPNVGKSSLINMLSQRRAARVGPVAGTTRNIQWIKVSAELTVSDYRGFFPSKETQDDLVRKGALNVQEGAERYAHAFAEKALESPKLLAWLEKRFDVKLGAAKKAEDVLLAIAQRRRLYMKGGEPNVAEASMILVRAMRESPEI